VPRQNLNNLESIDPELLGKAKVLGMVALEGGAARPLENDELEKLAHSEPLESKPKSRLFADRDQ